MIRLDRMPMTPLRRRFIDDLLLRNYSLRTVKTYVTGVVRVAKYFQRSPEGAGPTNRRPLRGGITVIGSYPGLPPWAGNAGPFGANPNWHSKIDCQ